MIMIELEQLVIGYRKSRRNLKALTVPLELSAAEGELVAVVGPNGVGKSTLLRTLARQQQALSGNILFSGRRWEEYDREAFARLCSYVPAASIPVDRMTVYDTVALGRYPYTGWQGRLSPSDHEAVERALERVKMREKQKEMIGELSDGERQRTILARALAQETPVVLLDEPTAFLDIPNRYLVLQLMRELSRSEGKLFLFSSHDLEFLLETADKIWLLYPDAAYEGSPEDLLRENHLLPLFRDTGIRYDPEKGLRIPHPDNGKTLVLTGEGDLFLWTEKALHRAGYRISAAEGTEPTGHIHVNPNEILLKKDGTHTRFPTLYSLLEHLKQS